MVLEFKYTKKVDPSKLHKQIANAGFNILGIMYDEGKNQTTVMLDDSETKDPSSVVEAYVYAPPVVHNYPGLFAEAKGTVGGALTQYSTAKSGYVSALQEWNAAGTTVTSGNAVAKLAACEKMVTACASALEASKDAIATLVSVTTVLAKNSNLEVEEE